MKKWKLEQVLSQSVKTVKLSREKARLELSARTLSTNKYRVNKVENNRHEGGIEKSTLWCLNKFFVDFNYKVW